MALISKRCSLYPSISLRRTMAPMMPSVSVTQTESWKTIDKRQRSGMVQAASADNAVTTSTSSPLPTEYVALAHQLADAAATVTSRYFRTPVSIDVKSDASPVTIADREAEAAMRHVIATNCPDHAVFGEEGGFQAGSTDNPEYMWVIDPIDGTKSFITGKPLFGTLIALLRNGTPVVGIIDQPILKERWLGVAGERSTLNGQPLKTRQCPQISAAFMYATTPHMFCGDNETAFNRVRDAVKIPLYGCDCYAYGLLAAGHCDLVVEADLKPYDYLALVPVIQGAGGKVTDWRGRALTWSTSAAAIGKAPAMEVAAAGDPVCHAQALELLAWT